MNCISTFLLVFLVHLSRNLAEIANVQSDEASVSTYRFQSQELNVPNNQLPRVCTPRLDLEPRIIPLFQEFQDKDTFDNIEQQVLGECQPVCLNGGVCRQDMGTKNKCLCPQNFTGPSCKEDNIPALVECDEATCRNGGFCIGTDSGPACSCPEHTRGPLCERRARSYKLAFRIIEPNGESYSQTVMNNLSRAAENLLHLSVKLGDDPTLIGAYLRSESDTTTNHSEGILVFRLMFDFSDSLAVVYTNQCVLGHVITGMDRLSKRLSNEAQTTVLGSVKMSDLDVQGENLCASGNHDCSRHAVCVPTNFGTYTCQCNAFTIDVSMDDRFPGRRCVYDGLVILVFILVGFLLSLLIILFCGCRRTIWYRCRRKHDSEQHMTLVNVAQNYDI